jgi:hypothetical protein
VFGAPFAGYWRDGKRVVMDRNAELPDRCVKCNEPANSYRRLVKLTHVGTGAELLFGWMAYAFAKRAQVMVGLCERHRRTSNVTIGLISLVAIIASIYLFTVRTSDWIVPVVALAGFLGGVAALIYAYLRSRLIRATKITDAHVWFKGAGEPFLASLPPAPEIAPGAALPTLEAPTARPPDPAALATAAYKDARNGAIAFLIGCLITAGTYLLLSGTYIVAWGAVLFGLYRLIVGLRAYVRVPAEHRPPAQLLTLGALVLVGVLAVGWVATEEVAATSFNSAVTAAGNYQKQGAALFSTVANRPGAWTAQDSADMAKVAGLYAQAADTLAASTPPSSYAWYRDGLVANFREAADIATQLSKQTSASSQASFDALSQRWAARVKDYNALQARLP